MANAKKTRKKPLPSWGLGKLIWTRATPPGWLEILRRADPSRKWELNGQVISTRCPYHDEEHASFKLTVSKKVGKCFGAGCGKAVTDIVQLIAKLRGCTYEAALIFLNEELHFDKDFSKEMGRLVEQHSLEDMKKAAAVAFAKVVDEFIRDAPDHLSYMRVAATYLEKARNVPVHMLCNLPVTIFPKPEHVKKYLDKDYHDAYDKYFAQVNNKTHWGSVLFYYNDSSGTISRFKLRNKAPDLNTILSGVENVEDLTPAAARNLFSKSFTVVADPIERPMGFFGLHHYSRLLSDSNTAVVVTEGEFDALAVMVGQLRNGTTLDFPILATGGMGSTNFDLLKDSWVKTVYAVADAPGAKRGDEVAYGWLCGTGKVNGLLKDESLNYKIFLWPEELSLAAGDLDEAVQAKGYDVVRKLIWADRDSTYLNFVDWVCRKCCAELDSLAQAYAEKTRLATGGEVEILNIGDELRREQRLAISRWIKAVPDKINRKVFSSVISSKYGINLETLDDVYTSIHNVNTVDGAAEAVAEELFDIVSIPYYTPRNGKPAYTVYSKVTEETLETPFSQDNAIEYAISKFVSGDMTKWMKHLLRNAVTTTPTEDELEKYNSPNAVRIEEVKRCTTVLKQVFTSNAHKVPDVNTLYKIGQGIHYRDLPGNTDTVYFVNGMKVFKGKINPESGAPIDWTRIHDLRDGDYWFSCARSFEWSNTVQAVEDLNCGMQVDLADTYDKIVRILDGWQFQDHEIMRKYIAAWIMSLPIQLAIDRVTVTCITGESTSGKSSFLQGLLGGTQSSTSRIPSIVEPAKVVTDATEAYLTQTFDRTSMFVGVDEAETDDNADHNKRMKSLMRLLYSSSTGGGDIGRGSANHTGSIEMKYKCPTILAAIHLPTDETFLTRTTIFYTRKQYKWKDIGDHINSVLGTSRELNDLRRSITTGLLSRLDEVRERADRLVSLTRQEDTDPPTTDRFRECVSVALAIYEMCGTEQDPHDPIKLYHDIVEANKSRLETILSADMKHPLLNTILYTRCVQGYKVQNGPLEVFSPRDLIIEGSRDDIDMLNNARTGVYCLPDRGWIILYWRQICTNILNTNPTYRELSEGALRESISKNKFLVSNVTDKDHKDIMRRISIEDAKLRAAYSVISTRYLIDNDDAEAPTKTVAGPSEDSDFSMDI